MTTLNRSASTLMTVGALLAALSSSFACPAPSTGNGGGEGEGQPAGGEGEGEGQPVSTALKGGDACTFTADTCDAGLVCTSIFSAAGASTVDTTGASCFAKCTQSGQACQSAIGASAGICSADPGHDGGLICVATSQSFGSCGNHANASSAVAGQACLSFADNPGTPVDEAASGFCATVCDVDAPTACVNGDRCSTEPVRLQSGAKTQGVCSPPSAVSDPCGFDGGIHVCTDGQLCVSNKCAAPAGGGGEGEGEGEGE